MPLPEFLLPFVGDEMTVEKGGPRWMQPGGLAAEWEALESGKKAGAARGSKTKDQSKSRAEEVAIKSGARASR